MKPSNKQLELVSDSIAAAYADQKLSNAEIGRIAGVHPSQVGRICSGKFKTFSHNVVQICKALGVKVPRLEPDAGETDPEWAQAQSSMRRVWDETPEGARVIARMLNAVAELQAKSDPR
ncbi:helix-turn-helix transcriptional regulator [Croceibacterium sp. TMG7-5b_MA50]|uniref:helix-turn-helix domain-containing protein n=1 Tax=Croceibacterium sp. TMG7-5b_MA50 TaxID=3121290 RepID=UPI0032219D68